MGDNKGCAQTSNTQKPCSDTPKICVDTALRRADSSAPKAAGAPTQSTGHHSAPLMRRTICRRLQGTSLCKFPHSVAYYSALDAALCGALYLGACYISSLPAAKRTDKTRTRKHKGERVRLVGGRGGIRTHGTFRYTAFRVRLVMTTSILFHFLFYNYYCNT